jgi:hypothetical protein
MRNPVRETFPSPMILRVWDQQKNMENHVVETLIDRGGNGIA